MYIESVINQIEYAVKTVVKMIDEIDLDDLNFRPISNKKSIGELVQHLCELIEGDLLISKGATKDEMNTFYSLSKANSLDEMKNLLMRGFNFIKIEYLRMDEENLMKVVTSYWGVKYTRFEWLLEILVHFTHHRAQLHTLMVHKNNDFNISLFE